MGVPVRLVSCAIFCKKWSCQTAWLSVRVLHEHQLLGPFLEPPLEKTTHLSPHSCHCRYSPSLGFHSRRKPCGQLQRGPYRPSAALIFEPSWPSFSSLCHLRLTPPIRHHLRTHPPLAFQTTLAHQRESLWGASSWVSHPPQRPFFSKQLCEGFPSHPGPSSLPCCAFCLHRPGPSLEGCQFLSHAPWLVQSCHPGLVVVIALIIFTRFSKASRAEAAWAFLVPSFTMAALPPGCHSVLQVQHCHCPQGVVWNCVISFLVTFLHWDTCSWQR